MKVIIIPDHGVSQAELQVAENHYGDAIKNECEIYEEGSIMILSACRIVLSLY